MADNKTVIYEQVVTSTTAPVLTTKPSHNNPVAKVTVIKEK